jgi:hypothetical protein
MNADQVKEWLNSRSVSSETVAGELRYVHPSGETSLLVLGNPRHSNVLSVKSPLLGAFYEAFSGASIGNGHIVIASNRVGGVDVSHGFTVPDLSEMRIHAERLGMPLGVDDVVFMHVASWMFVFAVDARGNMRRFDRDLKKVREVPGIESVFNDWWSIVLEDPI